MNFRPIIIDREPKTIQEAYALLVKLETAANCKSNDGVDQKLSEVLSLLKLKESKDKFYNPDIKRVEEFKPQYQEQQKTETKGGTMVGQYCSRVGHTAKFCYDLGESNQNCFNSNQGNKGRNNNN